MRALGLRPILAAVEDISEVRDACVRSHLVLEHSETFRGRADLRPYLRHLVEGFGGGLVGSSARAAQIADDKIAAQGRLREARLAVPRSAVVVGGERGQGLSEIPSLPAIVKRPFEHGSRGLALVSSRKALRDLVARWLEPAGGMLLVEDYVEGRELAVSILELEGRAAALPIVEVDLAGAPVYSRARKWGRGPLPIGPARLTRRDAQRIAMRALRAFRALGLRGYARFDLRFADGAEPVFLEANVRPSVEDGTEFRLAAALAGIEGADLLALLLDDAARRHGVPAPSDREGRAGRASARAAKALRAGALRWETVSHERREGHAGGPSRPPVPWARRLP